VGDQDWVYDKVRMLQKICEEQKEKIKQLELENLRLRETLHAQMSRSKIDEHVPQHVGITSYLASLSLWYS